MKKAIARISGWLDRICQYLITILLMWMTVVLTLQIIMRVVFNTGFTPAEEMARYSMIWMIFLGSAVAWREGSHISVEVLEQKVPVLRPYLRIVQDLLSLVYLIIIIWISWGALEIVQAQTSPNMGIPMSFVYISVPVSALLMIIHILYHFTSKKYKNREGATHE